MSDTITLSAEARFGNGGKQYIARIRGRNSKFVFEREFVGRKEGRRKEAATFITDEPGLFETCDIDRKGNKERSYVIVYHEPGEGLLRYDIGEEAAMAIAKRLPCDLRIEALRLLLEHHRGLPQDKELTITRPIGPVKRDRSLTRAELVRTIEEQLAAPGTTV